MDIIEDIQKTQFHPCVATIGFFDGVHLGHQNLVAQVRDIAAEEHLPSLLITFSNHPRKVLQSDYQPELLTTAHEKLCLLACSNPDYCLPLTFTPEMAALSARSFMEHYLRDLFQVRTLVIGYDHHFGHDTERTFEDYAAYGRQLGIRVVRAGEFLLEGENVSSSAVRFSLQVGDMEKAARLLGRPYSIDGRVIEGDKLGQTIGFPTANLDTQSIGKMLPMDGCYAVIVTHRNVLYPGMLYIGQRPTFGENHEKRVEVHILNFTEQIYHNVIHLVVVRRLRAEKHFSSIEELQQQLRRDMEKVEKIIK